MYFSKYNIFSKIRNSEDYYIVNLLSGQADIIDKSKALEINTGNYENTEEYISKGYIIDEKEEKKIYTNKYFNFIESRDKDEIQIFFIPWYACNFACSYCYQSGYENDPQPVSKEVIDSFFSYIAREFAGRRKYITIFGGEPLLSSANARNTIEYMLQKATEASLDTALVTNGYTLADYVPMLKKYRIREIQVTLDGTENIHNVRRPLKNSGPTFGNIVAGIDSALENNININLRAVIDKENLKDLAGLARFAIAKGWTKKYNFKTQLGRNYELHYCQASHSKLYSRLEFYEAIYALINENPEILEFHKPAFSISRFLFDNGETPAPLFDDCTGCKTEWAFDYTGKIYPCTATVGKKTEEVGTFYPSVTKNEMLVDEWKERDVTTIKECKTCSLQLACGGGCASIAKNQFGKINAPDCRPVKEQLEMGISLYFNKITD